MVNETGTLNQVEVKAFKIYNFERHRMGSPLDRPEKVFLEIKTRVFKCIPTRVLKLGKNIELKIAEAAY